MLDLRRRPIGLVLGLVDDPKSGEQRLAIRRGGVFGRRRLLPLDAVAAADAARRVVVVDERAQRAVRAEAEDADARGGAEDGEPTSRSARQPSLVSRVGLYTRASRSDADRDRVLDEAEPLASSPHVEEHHLRFVSAPAGYQLAARPGEPPAVGTQISGTDLPEPLVVVKVGPSPLPGDPRPCAYLERDNDVASPQRS